MIQGINMEKKSYNSIKGLSFYASFMMKMKSDGRNERMVTVTPAV